MRVIALLGKLSGRGASREGIIRGIRGDGGECVAPSHPERQSGVGRPQHERVSGKAALQHRATPKRLTRCWGGHGGKAPTKDTPLDADGETKALKYRAKVERADTPLGGREGEATIQR